MRNHLPKETLHDPFGTTRFGNAINDGSREVHGFWVSMQIFGESLDAVREPFVEKQWSWPHRRRRTPSTVARPQG